jgi:hypothetical protein
VPNFLTTRAKLSGIASSASILEEISSLEEILTSWKQLGNLLSLCREIAGARDILRKFEKTTRVKFQLMILHF